MNITSATNPDNGLWVKDWMTEWGFIGEPQNAKEVRALNKRLEELQKK